MQKFIPIVFAILFWAQYLCAQNNIIESERKWRFQIEAGCGYFYFPDKDPKYSGWGIPLPIYTRITKNPGFAHSFLSGKVILKNKHVFLYHRMDISTGSVISFPNTGQYGLFNKVQSLGYGYNIKFKKFYVLLNINTCYRTGQEHYLFGYAGGSGSIHRLQAHMAYQKHWGASLGVQIDYFVTYNVGLGINVGYFSFPFENTKPDGIDFNLINPQMAASAFPNKEIYIANVKLFYNFTLPKSLNKLNPFKRF